MSKVVLIPHSIDGNQYIRELGSSYEALGIKVVYGREQLFESLNTFDVIHLHWPEAIYRWGVTGSIEIKAKSMVEMLIHHKANGSKIVWTALNIEPHEKFPGNLDHSTYSEVIRIADIIIHHCANSVDQIEKLYSAAIGKKNLVIPRGNFSSLVNTTSIAEAREYLKIADTDFVFLHFGYIRVYKGLFKALVSFWKAQVKNKNLIIAGHFQSATGVSPKLDFFLLKLISMIDRRIRFHPQWIADEKVQYYFNAADCVLLTHKQGLNSGVANLSLKFGRLVIGPRIGCITDVLNSGLNLLYDPNNSRELIAALEKAPTLAKTLVFQKNTEAANRCRWENISTAIISSFWPSNSGNK